MICITSRPFLFIGHNCRPRFMFCFINRAEHVSAIEPHGVSRAYALSLLAGLVTLGQGHHKLNTAHN